jgi:cell division protein FtsB
LRAFGLGALLVTALAIPGLLDQDSGVAIWLELRADLAGASSRLEALSDQNDALRREVEQLETDPTAIYRAIREELDLALPGEMIVRFVRERGPAVAPVERSWSPFGAKTEAQDSR